MLQFSQADQPINVMHSYRVYESNEGNGTGLAGAVAHPYQYTNQACIQQNEILGIQEEDSGTIDDGVGSDQDEGGQKCIKNVAFAQNGFDADILQARRTRSKGKSQ